MLRVLQEHRFRPVGTDREIESNFRLIAATNRNIEEMVQEGQFREDLWHRLCGILIHLPPLREREGDLRELASYLVAQTCDRYKIKTKGISPDLLDFLTSYSWPGNIRELQHTIEWVIANSLDIPVLYPEHLPVEIRATVARTAFTYRKDELSQQPEVTEETFPTFKNYKNQVNEKYLTELIRRSRSNVGVARRLSGMSKTNLYALLKIYKKTLTE
jgi:two-component system, NtrC family, response regulator